MYIPLSSLLLQPLQHTTALLSSYTCTMHTLTTPAVYMHRYHSSQGMSRRACTSLWAFKSLVWTPRLQNTCSIGSCSNRVARLTVPYHGLHYVKLLLPATCPAPCSVYVGPIFHVRTCRPSIQLTVRVLHGTSWLLRDSILAIDKSACPRPGREQC